MQIGEFTYFDLEITGYNRKDFIKPEDVLDVEIVETAGASLPFIFVQLISDDKEMMKYIIQNNTFKITIGESKKNSDTFTVQIYSNNPPNTNGTGVRELVEFGGYIIDTSFMVNRVAETYFGNSLLVAKQVVKKYLNTKPKGGIVTNIDKVNEKPVVWRREGMRTACWFLAETLVHMDIRPSFPLFAFDKYGTFHLRDFDKVVKLGPTVTFVARPPEKLGEIQYYNSFNVEDFRETYNLYSGFNKVTEVWGAKNGMVQYAKSYNKPILASTQEAEVLDGTTTQALNLIQSSNVHDTYVEAFVHNTNKLVALSSMEGCLELIGRYYKSLKPTDLVTVKTSGEDKILDGFYVIDSIRTQIDMDRGGVLHTYVYVTRDNRNNVENYIANPKKGLKILKKFFAELANAVGQLRVAYAMAQNIMDGRYLKEIMSFAIETKRNLLRSFVVAGVGIDFNSSANLLQSLVCVGNSLMNTLTSMILPSSLADVFRDFVIRKPTLKSLLFKYISDYVPVELRSIISLLADSLFKTTNTLNSIAVSNGIRVTANNTAGNATGTDSITANVGDDTVIDNTNTSEIDYTAGSSEKVQDIVEELTNNSSWLGLDIPFPILDLTESQSLLSDEELKKYVADQTIANLTNLGYMKDLTTEQLDLFEKILLGDQPIENVSEVNDLANQINRNAGNTLYYRYWGVFGEGANDTLLFAWEAEDKIIFTDTLLLNSSSILYNFDGSPYKGDEFAIVKDNKNYRVVLQTELLMKPTVRNSTKDKKDKNLLDLTSYYIKKCYKDKYRTIPCTKLINASQNAHIFFACPSSEEDLKFYINSKRVDVIEDLEDKVEYLGKQVMGYFQIDLGYINGWGIPVPYNVYYTNIGYNSNSVLFEVKQGGMV